MSENYKQQMKSKFTVFFLIIILGFIIFISILFYWTKIDRNLPKFITSEANFAIRGNIISADGYVLATSQKLYKAMIDTRNIDPDKKELFINLYSIYSGDDKSRVKKIIESKSGNVVLSYRISSKTAEHLQILAKRLFRLGVFVSYKDPETGNAFLRGMSIVESGEVRSYPYIDTLSPVIGYIKKNEVDSFTRVEGVKGIERYYEDRLGPIQDSYLIGNRDISGAIILNGDSKAKQKIDGQSIELSIPIKLQKSVEKILDVAKSDFKAKEVMVIIMRSDTGDILSLATSNRYDINSIKKQDYPSLNINSVEYTYEPGSVMKPIVYAILLRENKIDPKELVRTYGGVYKIGKYTIRDEIKKDWMTAEDVLTYSSNIGMSQLAQRLDGASYHKGLVDFGLGRTTEIDLSRENKGQIRNSQSLDNKVYKATLSYGYGLNVNFLQIIRAFNVFNNNGVMISPKIASYIVEKSGKKHKIENNSLQNILSKAQADSIKKTLIKVIYEGSGRKALVKGLEIGGKTGTARIASGGSYDKVYNSSFIGFVNDKNKNKYTIGVLVVEPEVSNYRYYGSQSAAPIFKQIIEKMIDEEYLEQDNETSQK